MYGDEEYRTGKKPAKCTKGGKKLNQILNTRHR